MTDSASLFLALLESNDALLHRARDAEEKLHEAVSLLRLSHNLLPGGTTRDKVGAWLDRNGGGRS